MDDLKGKPMVPWHKWYILRRRDIDICIYICDRYYKPSLHVSTDCLHANTQDDHANYNLLRTNNFSLIFCHHAAHIGQKKQDAQKKYSQEAAGAFRHQHHHTLCLWSVATSFCQKATAGTKQSGSNAGCSYLKNSKGNGWISLRLFITSQPCRRNRELSSHSILQ